MTDLLCQWKRFLRTAAVLLCLAGCLAACGSDTVKMEYDAETGLPAVRTTVSAEPVPEKAPSAIPETEAETIPPETETETTPPAVVPAEVTFVLNTNTMRYHRTDCSGAAGIQPQNLAYHYGTAEELTAYTPCGICLKDIAEPAPPVTEPVSGGSAHDYVLNRNTMKFHYPSCKSVAKIKPENAGTFSGTRDELTAQGYDPCGSCDP